MKKRLHVKYPLFLSHFNVNLYYFGRFSKHAQISNFTKIRPLGTELFLAGGRTDRQTERRTGRQTGTQAGLTKLINALRNFANSPKNGKSHIVSVNCNTINIRRPKHAVKTLLLVCKQVHNMCVSNQCHKIRPCVQTNALFVVRLSYTIK